MNVERWKQLSSEIKYKVEKDYLASAKLAKLVQCRLVPEREARFYMASGLVEIKCHEPIKESTRRVQKQSEIGTWGLYYALREGFGKNIKDPWGYAREFVPKNLIFSIGEKLDQILLKHGLNQATKEIFALPGINVQTTDALWQEFNPLKLTSRYVLLVNSQQRKYIQQIAGFEIGTKAFADEVWHGFYVHYSALLDNPEHRNYCFAFHQDALGLWIRRLVVEEWEGNAAVALRLAAQAVLLEPKALCKIKVA